MTVGIIGAGISGLTVAYELQQRGIAYHLWEASPQAGGYIQSRRNTTADNSDAGATYLQELGPNSLLGDDDLLAWIDGLGLTPELTFSNPVSKVRYIFRDGYYRKLPTGPPSLLFGSFFSWKTKWAIFRERTNRTRSAPGETLAHFFRRRFTNELVDYALAPFVAGIYAGDPERLLVSETFPTLLQYEKEYGSVLRGLIKNQSVSSRKQSFSFQNGMQALPDALAGKLTHLSTKDPVRHLYRSGDQWTVVADSGSQTVDQLIIAVGTDAAARLLEPTHPDFSDALRLVDYPPMTVVHSAYKRTDVEHALNGFGGLNPAIEGRFCAGHIWSSSVFGSALQPTRCPADEVLFTTFVGGQQNPENARMPDGDIFREVHRELAGSFGIRVPEPVFHSLYRWERAIPQYDAHIVVVKQMADAVKDENLRICANWYGGLSLSDCLRKARQLAEEIAAKALINNF